MLRNLEIFLLISWSAFYINTNHDDKNTDIFKDKI